MKFNINIINELNESLENEIKSKKLVEAEQSTKLEETSIEEIKTRVEEIKAAEDAKYEEIPQKKTRKNPKLAKIKEAKEAKEKEEKLEEDSVVQIAGTNPEKDVDYIISDVTVLEPVSDGDVQAPDIDGLLTLVSESLKETYGEDWGRINILSSRVNESNSFALVDISTKEIIKEFEEKGIHDAAIGKNLILENSGSLIEFKVNSLNGTTRFSKKTTDAAQTIREWIETEFLHEAMKEKELELACLKAKTEKETVENYVANRPDLKLEMSNIEMFIEMGKSIKDEAFDKMIQNRMYGLAAEFPANIEIKNKDDKYELSFTSIDQIVEILFGKKWMKEKEEIPEVVELTENAKADVLIKDYFNNKMDLSELHDKLEKVFGNKKDAVEYFADNEKRLKNLTEDIEAKMYIDEYYPSEEEANAVAAKFKEQGRAAKVEKQGNEYAVWVSFGKVNESYSQFNIGDIEVVFNPDTYECLYSIPSAEVKDKKINLSNIPTVDQPYDTNTIIKSYIETKFGRIPTKEEKEMIDKQEVSAPVMEPEVQPEIPVEEAELPEEPGTEEISIEEPQAEEIQSETGDATFVKIRPKQASDIESIRARLLDGDTPKSSYIVTGERELSDDEWNNLTSNLTNPQPWLEGLQSIDRKNYSFNVLKVTNAGATFALLIDPLGYNYPRYVAIVE